jgi:hypothetical protein
LERQSPPSQAEKVGTIHRLTRHRLKLLGKRTKPSIARRFSTQRSGCVQCFGRSNGETVRGQFRQALNTCSARQLMRRPDAWNRCRFGSHTSHWPDPVRQLAWLRFVYGNLSAGTGMRQAPLYGLLLAVACTSSNNPATLRTATPIRAAYWRMRPARGTSP